MFLARAIAASRRRIFDPLSLSPALWLSDTGSDPAQWDDISGNGRHATQSNSSFRPSIATNALNGRQVRRFDGSNDSLTTASFSISQPYTSFCVFISTDIVTAQIALRGGSDVEAGVNIIVHRGATAFSGINAGTAFLPLASSPNWQILGTTGNGSNSFVFRNGTVSSSGNAGANAINGVGVGISRVGTDFLNGDIAEILIFPTALSTEDRQKVEQYLSTKYAIALA
jgi:hypothetical protein